MATNIEKTLNPAPLGLATLAEAEDPIDVILLNDDGTGLEESDEGEEEEAEEGFDDNLAEYMDEQELTALASDLLGDYEADLISRKEWLDTYIKGLKLLGLKHEERTEPFKGACGVVHPLLMESAVKFQSETIMETFPAAGPVKAKIIGKETPEKVEAAKRVQEDMNYELTEVMTEYRPEHERLLLALALSGNSFKKIYFDPAMERQTAPYIAAEDIVVPYGATSIESAERVTHCMRKTKNEVRKLQSAGFYRDIDLGDPVSIMTDMEKERAKDQGTSAIMDNRYQFLEMHVNRNLKGYEDKDDDGEETGIELPYVITLDQGSKNMLGIRRNWLEQDTRKVRRQHFVHYGYVPGFGFYYFGLIHLIGGHSQSATSLMRQLIDAGTLSNLPGGLKARGLRIKGDDSPIAPGEFRDVDLPSGAIRDNILPLPYKEPSLVLAGLLDKVVEDGRRFAAVADLQVSDMSAQSPVGTTLAILERVLKVMSAVQARIHYTMKQEFKLLAAIIRDNTPSSYSYQPEEGNATSKQSDYDSVDIIPVSDPNASTMSQRVVQYQAVLQLSQTAPQIYDLPFLHRQMIDTLGVKNAEKIVPSDDDMKPVDPVSENMAVMTGKPVKAFLIQDHEAHLAVHMSAMQDPKIMQMIGQNPSAPAIMAAAHAHVMEHVAFQYRREIEKQLGAALPPMPDKSRDEDPPEMSPEMEAQLAQLTAQAAGKLLMKDQKEAAAQQAAQQAQDPLIQMQMKDIAIKEGELERKRQKDLVDAAAKQDDLEQRNQKMMIDAAAKADEMELREKEVGTQIEGDMLRQQMEAAGRMQDMQQSREEGAIKRDQIAREGQVKLVLKQAEGEQKLQQTREQGAVKIEMMKKQAAAKPKPKPSGSKE